MSFTIDQTDRGQVVPEQSVGDELEGLGRQGKYPIRILLCPAGKTLVLILKCRSQHLLAGRLQQILGEPEREGILEDSESYAMLFTHQNIPNAFKPLIRTPDELEVRDVRYEHF